MEPSVLQRIMSFQKQIVQARTSALQEEPFSNPYYWECGRMCQSELWSESAASNIFFFQDYSPFALFEGSIFYFSLRQKCTNIDNIFTQYFPLPLWLLFTAYSQHRHTADMHLMHFYTWKIGSSEEWHYILPLQMGERCKCLKKLLCA